MRDDGARTEAGWSQDGGRMDSGWSLAGDCSEPRVPDRAPSRSWAEPEELEPLMGYGPRMERRNPCPTAFQSKVFILEILSFQGP
jgi:hypothetical protein